MKPAEEIKDLTVQAPNDLDKPRHDTEFAEKSATFLVDIIKKNGWSKKLGGQSEHVMYEGWQTAGKYYGLSVKTHDAEYVELGNSHGFKAKATVVNEITGVEVGSAEAYCMDDEPNWRSKPKFQLASMAQTRAGSKALRQILGFVIALAGYNPTPKEEMDGVEPAVVIAERLDQKQEDQAEETNGSGRLASDKQLSFIERLLEQKGHTQEELLDKYQVTKPEDLTQEQASAIISNLLKLPNHE